MGREQSARRSGPEIGTYVLLVALSGAVAISFSLNELLQQGAEYRRQWVSLVALTMVSGLMPVPIRAIDVSISTSETFIIAGTILFGKAGGTTLALLDGLFISVYLAYRKGLRWQQFFFNITATPLSIWLATQATGIKPLFGTTGSFDFGLLMHLGAFSTLYFLIHSWLLAFALAIDRRASPLKVWLSYPKDLVVTYASGASIAALLVYNTRQVQPEFVLAITPLLIVLFLAFRWSNRRVEVERERNTELNRVFMSTIEALALAIDAKDQVTHGHIRRVQRFTLALANALGIKDQRELDAIRAAALLHDTGKLAVPEYILNKPGPLTASEFERMKVHADVGADILKSIDFPYPVEPIVRHHHEQWDGRGYPAGLRGQEIPMGARILSVVDCYDALTSDRPYRPRMSRAQAEQVLKDRRGKAYDPWVVDRFIELLDQLEAMESTDEDEAVSRSTAGADTKRRQIEAIVATTAEEREFSELRRELSRTADLAPATDTLLRHIKRMVPAEAFAFCAPKPESNELTVVASVGVGASGMAGAAVDIGERVSGWAFAHAQVVLNADASLELGPEAKTLPVPLRYATAVPVVDRKPVAVVMAYSAEPLDKDHARQIESAAALFASCVSENGRQTRPVPRPAAVEYLKPQAH